MGGFEGEAVGWMVGTEVGWGQVDAMPHPIHLRDQQLMVISRTMSTENEGTHRYAGQWNGFINSDWPGHGVGHAVEEVHSQAIPGLFGDYTGLSSITGKPGA
jgi:hypothetical protein